MSRLLVGGRRSGLIVAGLALLIVAGTASAVVTVEKRSADEVLPPRSAQVGASSSASVPAPAGPAASPVASGPPPEEAVVTVRYTFDSGLPGEVADVGGLLPLSPKKAAGGAVTAEARDGGHAVRFPQTCPKYGDKSCPRIVLESRNAPMLNPRAGHLRYGATVRMKPNETARGENILQKGYSQAGSQYKLQVDGAAGRPSCVIVGTTSDRIHVLAATTSVADDRWHAVECERSGATVTIRIDGVDAGTMTIPVDLSVNNSEPLRVGGKGTSPNNDQFHGAVDDVFVVVG